MKKRLLSIVAIVATMVAGVVASSACLFYNYQPEEPKSLREE